MNVIAQSEAEALLENTPWYEHPTHRVITSDGAIWTVFPAYEGADGEKIAERRILKVPGSVNIDLGREFRFPNCRDEDALTWRLRLLRKHAKFAR